MSILSTIKSLLGVGRGDGGRSVDEGTPVAVEREPAAESERAVKGVDPAPSTDDSGPSDPTPDAPADGATPAGGGGAEPVDSIKGIGASYADRLAEAGVHTVEDLARADAEALAAETDLGAGRLGSWIERARARTR